MKKSDKKSILSFIQGKISEDEFRKETSAKRNASRKKQSQKRKPFLMV